MSRLVLIVMSCLVLAAFGYAWLDASKPVHTSRAEREEQREPVTVAPKTADVRADEAHVPNEPAALTQHVRFVAIGGGATPESTEVSLEQDIELAARVFTGPGHVLFAGGAQAASVRTLDPGIDATNVLIRLGDFFEPRSGRTSRYRKSKLAARATTLESTEQVLTAALGDGDDPLLVYIASHGEQGEQARYNHVVLWGGDSLTVSRLAELHDSSRRPLHMLIASCFSGGFAEMAFTRAEERAGFARAPRCGLFAGTWDRETSGCDPNPDRRAQESYSLHLLHALRSEDRDGHALAPKDIDFDANGEVTLLEAHTRARIASRSIDVPTSTSERYLRAVEKGIGALDATLLPEDAALIAQLGTALELPTRDAAEARWRTLDQKLDELDSELGKAEGELDRAHAALASRLLGRWAVVDDAYHPDFAPTLAAHGPAIAHELDDSREAKAYGVAMQRVDSLDASFRDTQTREAVVMRLLRAYQTLQLAAALSKRGGQQLRNYQALLACERSMP